MKKIFILLMACLMICNVSMAQKKHAIFKWQDQNREYVVFEPENASLKDTPRPIYFALHGLHSNIDSVIKAVDFSAIAKQTGWIVVVPQAMPFTASAFGMSADLGCTWNSGISISFMGQTLSLNPGIDDSGFLMALLDSMENKYSIDKDSVFFAGISMGGFMTQRMAIEHSDRITSIASVSGTIANTLKDKKPTHNVNVLHVHGTADTIVSYDGKFKVGQMQFTIGLGAEATVEYWRSFNGCSKTDYCDTLPHAQNDNLLFVRHRYYSDNAANRVAFVKIDNGKHWFYGAGDGCDVNLSDVIYAFFTDKFKPSASGIASHKQLNTKVYPNPVQDVVNVELPSSINYATISIFDAAGREVVRQNANESLNRISVANLVRGLYFIRVQSAQGTNTQKIVVE